MVFDSPGVIGIPQVKDCRTAFTVACGVRNQGSRWASWNDAGGVCHDLDELYAGLRISLCLGQSQLGALTVFRAPIRQTSPIFGIYREEEARMGSYAHQFGPGSVWYYPEAPPPPPAVPLRYLPQSGESFGQPNMYTPFPPVDPALPIHNAAVSFDTPAPIDIAGSSARQDLTPVEDTDRRRYRIKRIRTVSIPPRCVFGLTRMFFFSHWRPGLRRMPETETTM